jgi:hypothetical protein
MGYLSIAGYRFSVGDFTDANTDIAKANQYGSTIQALSSACADD